ncbi:MAG: peptidase, partial [Acidobacteria bacterium]|nr:peptidase [Acidobacteriota bacterium]
TTRSAEEIARGVEALGASLESGAGWDQSYVALSSLSTTFPQALAYVADVARHPTFKGDELDRLRDQNIDALSVSLQQPRSLAGFVATRVLFGQSPYGHSLGGTPESLRKITRADLTRFHATWFRPDNAILVVAGDVTSADAFALARKLFGGWSKPATKLPLTAAKVAGTSEPHVVVVDLPKAGQAAVLVTRAGLRRADPAYNVAEVANAVLGGGYSARLNQEIRIKRGLSYGAGSSFDSRRAAGQFTASAQTKNESASEVAGIILDEMNRLGAKPLEPAELTARKAVLVGDFGRGLETGAGLVSQVAELALYGLGLGEIDRYIGHVSAVTPAEVQTFARTGLGGGQASIVIAGDAGKFLIPLRQRFKNVEVIPVDQLDLNKASLRK